MRPTTIGAWLAVVTVCLATAGAEAADAQVKLLAGDASRTVFEVSFPAHDAVIADPVLVIPADADPKWRVRSVTWWTEPAGAPDPAGLVEVDGPLVMRGMGLLYFGVQPQLGGAAPASVVIEVDHPAAGNQAPWLNRIDEEPTWLAEAATESQPPNLVNPAMYAPLRVAARLAATDAAKAARRVVPDWFSLSSTWVRLEVKATGPYALTGQQLQAMSVNLAPIDPATLRLYRGGGMMLPHDPTLADDDIADRMGLNEVAIAVEAGDDGSFELADRILFYGFGTDAWLDRLDPSARPLDTFEHRSCEAGVYWLTWSNPGQPTPLPGTPRRIATVAAPAHAGVTPLMEHWARLHAEESYASVPGVVQDMFAWESAIISSLAQPFYLEAAVTGAPATFVVDVRGRASSRTSPTWVTRAWLNNDTAGAAALTFTESTMSVADSLRIRLRGTSATAASGANLLHLAYDNYSVDAPGGGYHMPLVLDSFDVKYRQQLNKAGVTGALAVNHWADEVAAPGTPVNLRITVPAASAVRVWDVTDPASVRTLAPTVESGAVTVGLTRDPATSAQLLVIADGDFRSVVRGAKVDVNPLREDVGAVDYIVITPPAFRAAAEALADLRRRVLPGVANPAVAVVTTDDIFANFSGGQKDPLAIRNFLRWNFNAFGQRLRYACLVGDASVDYRNRLGFDPATQLVDWLPTPYDINFPTYVPGGDQGNYNSFATDDDLAAFDAPPANRTYDVPDIATGRLIVTSPANALEMVERLRRYTESPESGLWRNRVLFAADDLHQGDIWSETYHTRQAESLARFYVPVSIDMEKVYGINYPMVGQYKPAARADLLGRLNVGQSIMYYVGHGSPTLLSDEQMMLGTDARSLTNGDRRFLFLALSCDVGMYAETTSQSMAEDMVTSREGGAIAAVAASMVSYVTQNDSLSNKYFRALYPQQHVRAYVTIGDALRAAKVGMRPEGDFGIRNSRRYTLLGDPALRLPHPIDDLTFAPASLDSILTGRPLQVVVDAAGQGLGVGGGVSYDLRVEESALDRLYYGSNAWREAGNTMFRGTGAVAEDQLTVPFLAPLQMRRGPLGRVRLIVDDHGQQRAAVATVPVVAAEAASNDHQGPAIALQVEGGRYRVQPGTPLQATLADTSGVNILGSNPLNSVLLEFDGNGLYSDVSDLFAFAPGSYTRGRLEVPLPGDLGMGPHRVALLASDMFDNVGSDTLSFELSAAGVTDIYDATVFPNPTPGPCRLVCETTDAMSLQWDIYTVSGRRLRSLRMEHTAAGPAILEWDGRDGEGDQIANGVYLYVLRGTATADPEHQIRKTGQLVIMR